MSVVAIVCARGGSKGIPRKNIRAFAGHPLIAWTIRAALAADGIEHVVLSSDDDDILAVAEAHGALPHRRPDALATDEAATEPVVLDVLQQHPIGQQATTVVLMQATSPLTRPADLDAALHQMEAGHLDSLLSVVENHVFQWSLGQDGTATPLNYDPQHRPRRQDIPIVLLKTALSTSPLVRCGMQRPAASVGERAPTSCSRGRPGKSTPKTTGSALNRSWPSATSPGVIRTRGRPWALVPWLHG